jgi:hypothetical protein
MAKEKNKPVPVRFDLKLLEVLKEEEKIETPQQALNFLSQFWENNRPAKEDFEQGLTDVKLKEPAAKDAHAKDPKVKDAKATPPKSGEPKKKAGEPAAHPSGLSGIDLSIWKAEQKEKEKNR